MKNLFNIDCGEVFYVQGLVIGGTTTIRGQWPFLVALHHLEANAFFCGGNLITSRHVLTGRLTFIDNCVESTILISIQLLIACRIKINPNNCKLMNSLFYSVALILHIAMSHSPSKEMSIKFTSIQIGDIWMTSGTPILRFLR